MADSEDLVTQAQILVDKIRDSSSIDFLEDWKIVHFYADSNDLCSITCGNQTSDPQDWIQDVQAALDYLSSSLPRTFVNLIQPLNIMQLLRDIKENSRDTGSLFSLGLSETCCPEVANTALTSWTLGNIPSIGDGYSYSVYQNKIQELIDSGRYDTTDDFTVVLQPFLETIPYGYDSNTGRHNDFHWNSYSFSPNGNRKAAYSLWNNMFERVGFKNRVFRSNLSVLCPTEEQPYVYTSKNSCKYAE